MQKASIRLNTGRFTILNNSEIARIGGLLLDCYSAGKVFTLYHLVSVLVKSNTSQPNALVHANS